MEKVYIVILNYKKWQDAAECLESVFNLQYENFTVFVIDNDSQNNSLTYLKQWAEERKPEHAIAYTYFNSSQLREVRDPSLLPQLVFIQHNRNDGFAKGNNVVLQCLVDQNAYTWLLNPDMVVDKNALTELVNFAHRQPFNSIIGSVLKSYSQPGKIYLYGGGKVNFNFATVYLVNRPDKIQKLEYISGGALFVHASHFKKLGLLPEEYFLYWEETDWCYRAKQAGYLMHVCLTAICYDKISSTIGKGFLANYYYTRNGLIFLHKFKKEKLPGATFFTCVRILKRVLTGRWDRARGAYKGMLSFINKYK